MVIESSKVGFSGTRQYQRQEIKQKATMEVRGNRNAAEVLISDESKSKLEQVNEYNASMRQKAIDDEKQRKENEGKWASKMLQEMKENEKNSARWMAPEEDATITMLKRMLAILRGEKDPLELKKLSKELKPQENCGQVNANVGTSFTLSSNFDSKISVSAKDVVANKNFSNGNFWTRATVQSSFVSESEVTAFSSTGYAKTADGREINFNIEVEMSRSFESTFESLSYETIFRDPLVINVDSNVASVSDMKFRFDLDGDGKEEEISAANNGSMFLALDKNGDGTINDGSELFGAKTGDGFKELAEYDSDGNGWIDEADEVFDKLVLWTKDASGNDVKIKLKDADVGAISLGYAKTQFDLNGANNKTNGRIQSTGIYLKESGGVGTVQHVDLAI